MTPVINALFISECGLQNAESDDFELQPRIAETCERVNVRTLERSLITDPRAGEMGKNVNADASLRRHVGAAVKYDHVCIGFGRSGRLVPHLRARRDTVLEGKMGEVGNITIAVNEEAALAFSMQLRNQLRDAVAQIAEQGHHVGQVFVGAARELGASFRSEYIAHGLAVELRNFDISRLCQPPKHEIHHAERNPSLAGHLPLRRIVPPGQDVQ